VCRVPSPEQVAVEDFYLQRDQEGRKHPRLASTQHDAAGNDTARARADRKIHERKQPLPPVPTRAVRPDHDVEAALVLRRAAGGGHRRV